MSNAPCKLPLIIAKGRFKHLSMLDEEELDKFLSYLLRFTRKHFEEDINQMPLWWKESVFYHSDYARGLIPAPDARNKIVKLRRLIKLCYLHYECKSLLIMSEELATQHPQSYKFSLEPSGCIAVYRVKTMSVMVRIPASNLDYNVERMPPQNGHTRLAAPGNWLSESISISPIQRNPHTTLLSPPKKDQRQPVCIVIDSSSSDDEVEIVSYEPGALPPTPEKLRMPAVRPAVYIRPGPACSKVRPARPFIGPASVQQKYRAALDLCRPPQSSRYQSPPVVPAKTKYLLCRPRRNVTIHQVDLTVDDDEDDDTVHPTRPKDCTPSDFFARLGLGPATDSPPSKPAAPPPVILTNKRLNVRDIPCTDIPYLVSIGYVPRRALCTPDDLKRRTEFIDKHTGKDTNWFLVSVCTLDKSAIAAVVRKCSISLRRLNSADMRRWKTR